MKIHVPLTITLLAAVVVVALAGKEEGESISSKEKSAVSRGIELYRACEGIRAGDPTIKKPSIDALFKQGLVGYRILHLEWIAESNTEIRDYILQGFAKMGDHKYIASDFPQDWVDASNRFSEPERSARLAELNKYFKYEIEHDGDRAEVMVSESPVNADESND